MSCYLVLSDQLADSFALGDSQEAQRDSRRPDHRCYTLPAGSRSQLSGADFRQKAVKENRAVSGTEDVLHVNIFWCIFMSSFLCCPQSQHAFTDWLENVMTL